MYLKSPTTVKNSLLHLIKASMKKKRKKSQNWLHWLEDYPNLQIEVNKKKRLNFLTETIAFNPVTHESRRRKRIITKLLYWIEDMH